MKSISQLFLLDVHEIKWRANGQVSTAPHTFFLRKRARNLTNVFTRVLKKCLESKVNWRSQYEVKRFSSIYPNPNYFAVPPQYTFILQLHAFRISTIISFVLIYSISNIVDISEPRYLKQNWILQSYCIKHSSKKTPRNNIMIFKNDLLYIWMLIIILNNLFFFKLIHPEEYTKK